MIAALYVETGGAYFGIEGVDPWDIKRDARKYSGPYPVVCHPPCQRWGNYATSKGQSVGDDDGCFEHALWAVRTFGGVLEHPAGSKAWDHFGLRRPMQSGWGIADLYGGYTTRVDQGAYGHRAQKATWLYACRVELPELDWTRAIKRLPIPEGATAEQRRRILKTGVCQNLSRKQRAATPPAFRDLLLSIARSAYALKAVA